MCSQAGQLSYTRYTEVWSKRNESFEMDEIPAQSSCAKGAEVMKSTNTHKSGGTG